MSTQQLPAVVRIPGADLPEHPEFLWDNPDPKRCYDVLIVGGGGHGLATAYYLATNHGVRNIAVLERGWLAGGNMARNTTIIRSNYLWDESCGIYEHSLKLWETLDTELDYPILFSQRGVLNLAHSLQDVRDSVRRVNANRLNGIDAEWIDAGQVQQLCPIVNISSDVRYPVLGATYQPRAGIAKHDYVAWGFARRANDLGVDLIQNCEVTGIDTVGERVVGLRTTRGPIAAGKVALCAAGHTSVLSKMVGLDLPIQSHPLQALVSELLEPVHPTVVMSNAVHVYVSQAHKGELVIGAGVDAQNGYAQRGAFHIIERQMSAALDPRPTSIPVPSTARCPSTTPRGSPVPAEASTRSATRPPGSASGSTSTTSPTTSRTTVRARRTCSSRCTATGSPGVWCRPPAWSCTARAGTCAPSTARSPLATVVPRTWTAIGSSRRARSVGTQSPRQRSTSRRP